MYLRKMDTVNLTGVLSKKSDGGIHPYHEILAIWEGVVLLQWMGRDYMADSPALFLLPPNTPHLLVKQSAACRFGFIELDMQGSTDFPELVQAAIWNGMQCDIEPQLPEIAPIYQTAFTMWDRLDPQSTYKPIARDLIVLDVRKLLLMIDCFLKTREPRSFRSLKSPSFPDPDGSNDRIREIIRYMESNYHNSITVNQLASNAHLDVSYFIRSFHKIARRTPLQYLHDLRLNAAACFLTTTGMPVQEITEAVGFQSIHYFSRLFKQKYGVSPSLWRKRQS